MRGSEREKESGKSELGKEGGREGHTGLQRDRTESRSPYCQDQHSRFYFKQWPKLFYRLFIKLYSKVFIFVFCILLSKHFNNKRSFLERCISPEV